MTLFIDILILVGSHIVLETINWWYTKYKTEKKKVFQFYEGLKPVVRYVTELRKNGNINIDEAREFIKTIEKSFNENFELNKLLTKDFGVYDNEMQLPCGICGDGENKIARDNLCQHCDLNCSIWNFK